MVIRLRILHRPWFLLLCLGFFVIFCILGTWQIHRYHYKKSLLALYQSRMAELPLPFSAAIKKAGSDLQFQPVSLDGNYMNALTVWVQGQYQGQPGFEVLTPFRLINDKKLLLVDRGWIAKTTEHGLPKIALVSGRQRIAGYIKLNEYRFILGPNILSQRVLPMVVQRIDVNELSRVMHHAFYPFVLRLNPKESNGFVRDWNVVTVVPERHLAYALQWFGLAIVIFVGYLAFSRSELPRKNASH